MNVFSKSRRSLGFQEDFSCEELRQRRARLIAQIGGGAAAVLAGAPMSGAMDEFRQFNDFYYLTGLETPHAYLLLDGTSMHATLYMPPGDERRRRVDGPELCLEEDELLREWTGVDRVRPLDELAADMLKFPCVYAPHAPPEARQACRDSLRESHHAADADPNHGGGPVERRFIERLRESNSHAEFHDLSPLLDAMRLVKSPAEVAVMRRAGRLTAEAIVEAMRSTRPGVMEFELTAVADYVFRCNGARGGAYRAIVAGGANIYSAHYWRNNCPLADGDLVLMDYAPDLRYYTSDIGRMWPVGGAYAPWQRELYGLVVEYHKVLLDKIRPGVTAAAVMSETAAAMRPVIEAREFSRPSFRQAALDLLDFQGHMSHSVGMAVHDVGDYRDQPLCVGHVFAVDPQLWVRDERLYIRVEDTVVVTDDGCEVLTAAAPLELDDVEQTVRETGMLQRYPALQP
ncbi:MAG: Xaa-Pro peptidase family protein [Pirellulaceae bacterium]